MAGRDGPRRCLLLREALMPGEGAPPLTGRRHADVCIVGGGYLGLWTALAIKQAEPGSSVAIVEADICGGGASGRNSGMALGYWSKLEALVARCGTDGALRLCEASVEAIAEIGEFARARALDIELRRSGWLWGATCPRQSGRWQAVCEAAAGLGREPFRLLDRAGIEAMVDAPGFLDAAFDASAATLNPAKLVRGLRRAAIDAGVEIFEHSPMLRLDRGARPRIATRRGEVTAERLVLAMNAWSLAIPELRPGILVIASDDLITAPAPDFLSRHRWSAGPLLTDSGVFVSGYRPAADGRIVAGVTGGAIGFGSLAGQRFEGRSPREAEIVRALAAGFRDDRVPRPLDSWRGPIDRTRDGLPLFGCLPGHERILFGYGFSGNGIVGCRLGGRILASLALGRRDEWSESGLVGPVERFMPPEPIRWVGAHMVRWAVRQKDRRDAEGREQGPVGRYLASLAPGGIVTTRSTGPASEGRAMR